jgi:predicted secreted hydrolase
VRRAIVVGALLATSAAANPAPWPTVLPGGSIAFPADEGAHPDYRTEWWYGTGWLTTAAGEPLGFQVTFFRTRPVPTDDNPSAFAARQILIAHAAVSDPVRGRPWHDQRIARAGFDLATAASDHTGVRIRDWSLEGSGAAFTTVVRADGFAFDLKLGRTQAALANGRDGYSQKGPAAGSASWYYSVPQLEVTGTVTRAGRTDRVAGHAWLDHEWSSAYLDAESVGWDWLGLNLDDGGALMAFRIRGTDGETRWAGGTLRSRAGAVQVFAPSEIEFRPVRRWRSPRTAIAWPVESRVRVGTLEISLAPLMDDQENDSRLTTGAVYWEGAVTATADGRRLGRGYLELTGYGDPLRLR